MPHLDEEKLKSYAKVLFGALGGAMTSAMVHLGDRPREADQRRELREEARAEGRVALVCEDGGALRCEREPALAAVLEQTRGPLLMQPLAQPALGEPRPGGQLGARRGAEPRQGAVEPEAVAQVDHRRGHGAAERSEEVLRVVL